MSKEQIRLAIAALIYMLQNRDDLSTWGADRIYDTVKMYCMNDKAAADLAVIMYVQTINTAEMVYRP